MKILLTLLFTFTAINIYTQTYKLYQTDNINNQLKLNTKTGEIYQVQNDGQTFLLHPSTTPNNEIANRYCLYKTQNMWTFILVDSFNGMLWQCQYSVKDTENIFSIPINLQPLSYTLKSKFTIQPMTSMFQFYLINDDTGDMWKFQWSTKGEEYRWIEKI